MNNTRKQPVTLQQRVAMLESKLESLSKFEEQKIVERVEKLESNFFETKSLFTLEEASAFLGISRALLYKMTSKMMIPHLKPRGKMVYFEKEELVAWVKQGHITALSSRTVTLDELRSLCSEVK